MIFWVPDSFPLICQKHFKFAGPFLHPPQAVHFDFGAPYVLFTTNFPTESSHTLCKSLSSYRKKVKLTFELQWNGAKHCGLILLRKIRCFLKRTRFLTYFELPVGSSTVCKDFASKTMRFLHFCNFPVESSSKHVILEWKLPGLDTQKMTTCGIRQCGSFQITWKRTHFLWCLKASKTWELSTYMAKETNALNHVFCCFETWELSTRTRFLDKGSTEKWTRG